MTVRIGRANVHSWFTPIRLRINIRLLLVGKQAVGATLRLRHRNGTRTNTVGGVKQSRLIRANQFWSGS